MNSRLSVKTAAVAAQTEQVTFQYVTEWTTTSTFEVSSHILFSGEERQHVIGYNYRVRHTVKPLQSDTQWGLKYRIRRLLDYGVTLNIL